MSFDPNVINSAGLSQVTPEEQAQRDAAIAATANPLVPIVSRYAAPANDGIPVGKANPNTAKANQKADGAKGEALAVTVIKLVDSQAMGLARILKNICELSQEGRTKFRAFLKADLNWKKEQLANLDKDSGDYEIVRRTVNSANTRVSELIQFSTAVDRGYTFEDFKNYHTSISEARMFNEGSSDNGKAGPTRRRGRPATPFVDKFKKFLVDNVTADNHAEATEFFNQWMALQNFDKVVGE